MFIQGPEKWEKMHFKPIPPPAGSRKHWNAKLERWVEYRVGDMVYLYQELFVKEKRHVHYKQNQEKDDHYPSCHFNVVFMTPRYCELLAKRDAFIEENEQLRRDVTLQKIYFPISGHCIIDHFRPIQESFKTHSIICVTLTEI